MGFCCLRYYISFVSAFLSFTWRRNMKKDSVSCIICDRQILRLATCTCICVRNRWIEWLKLKICNPSFGWRTQQYVVMCEHSGSVNVWLIQVIMTVIPDIINIWLFTICHNTQITPTSSCKENSVYCAVISILCLCVVSPWNCKLTKNRETGCWYCMTLDINCGSSALVL